MIHKISLAWSRVVLSSVLTALLVWPPGLFAWTEPAVAFSGEATVVNATVLGIKTTVSDTGPLSPSGGALQTSLLSASVPGLLTADVAHASTIGQADRARSEAAVAEVIINQQSSSVSGNTGSITVNALHVIVPDVLGVPGADVVVSAAHADVTCQAAPACIGRDFATGGGWILGPSGAKANF